MAKKLTPREQYLEAYDRIVKDGWWTDELIAWVRDANRKPAILSFTQGSARNVAYAIEAALRVERGTTEVIPTLKMRPTEQCPRCGFKQIVNEPHG